MPWFVIDRFAGGEAFLEDAARHMRRVPRSVLPKGAAPGDVLQQEADGAYRLDAEKTAARKARVAEKMRLLWKD
nr:DUF3006 domain-containing protein [Maliibacterium massiliense]